MRDARFVAVHRGGLLTDDDHRLLMGWALACTFHVLPLFHTQLDERLAEALNVARQWADRETATGACIKASRVAHAYARQAKERTEELLARCIGQAVATAHMADHCLGPAWYARKLVAHSGGSAEAERAWQIGQLRALPSHLQLLISMARKFLANP